MSGSRIPSDIEFAPNMDEDAVFVITELHKAGLFPKQMYLGNEPERIPYVVLDHKTYPGIEAHLFTIADTALWFPEFMPNGDIIIFDCFEWTKECMYDDIQEWRTNAWGMLLGGIKEVMEWLEPYRERTAQEGPDVVWAHHEIEWWTAHWEVPENVPRPVESFIDKIDESIQPHIRELSELGFVTISSCSGMRKDHHERRPMLPYVMFDCESYFDVSAHLFTLADIAGWDPSFGAHGWDVCLDYSYDDFDEGYLRVWDKLVEAARKLGPYLKEYRELVDEDTFTLYAWERRHRKGAAVHIPNIYEPISPVFVDENGNVIEEDEDTD